MDQMHQRKINILQQDKVKRKRLQKLVDYNKSNMEWKHKIENQSLAFSNSVAVADNITNGSVNENYTAIPAPTGSNVDENITRIEEKIDQHKVSRDQGIIMLDSIKATEVACLGLCLGSFGLNKDLDKGGFENSCSPSDSLQHSIFVRSKCANITRGCKFYYCIFNCSYCSGIRNGRSSSNYSFFFPTATNAYVSSS